jgi:hypothetical protein
VSAAFHSVTVHLRTVERGKIGIGDDVLGEHAADGIGDRGTLAPERRDLALDDLYGFCYWESFSRQYYIQRTANKSSIFT